MRLSYHFPCAKKRPDEDKVSRSEVYTVVYNVSLKDNNISRYIAQAHGISSDDDGTLRLNYEGRKQAQQYIADVFNLELTDSWPPSSDTRSTSNRSKKPSRKSSEQHSSVDADVAGWVSHEVTRTLA